MSSVFVIKWLRSNWELVSWILVALTLWFLSGLLSLFFLRGSDDSED